MINGSIAGPRADQRPRSGPTWTRCAAHASSTSSPCSITWARAVANRANEKHSETRSDNVLRAGHLENAPKHVNTLFEKGNVTLNSRSSAMQVHRVSIVPIALFRSDRFFGFRAWCRTPPNRRKPRHYSRRGFLYLITATLRGVNRKASA